MMTEKRNKWVCMDCDRSADNIICEGEFRHNVLDYEHVDGRIYLFNSIAHPIITDRLCDGGCGRVTLCFKRTDMYEEEKKVVVVSESEPLDVSDDIQVEEVLLTPEQELELLRQRLREIEGEE